MKTIISLRFLLAWLSSVLIYFALGWLFYDELLHPFFQNHIIKYPGLIFDEPKIMPAILANSSIAFLIVFVCKITQSEKSWKKGAALGLLISLLVGLYYDFIMYSYLNLLDIQATLMDIAINGTAGMLCGAAAMAFFRTENSAYES